MRVRFACALIAIGIAFAPSAAAQDTTPGENLGGYDAQASAMAVSFQPVFPALLPTGDAPLEGTVALSTGRVKSGGNAFGRASIIWPGNAAADPGPLLGQLRGPEFGALFPKWPLQAQADQEDGEVNTGAPPGMSMKAIGYPDRAYGDVRIADANTPGLLHVEHIASTSDTVVTDSAVSSVARVTLHGVAIANGFITVEEIRSLSRTSGSGSTSAAAGDVDVVGMKIGGIDVSVTDDGFKVTGLPPEGGDAPGAGGEPFPGQSPEEQVQEVLANLNARITLFQGVSRTNGGQAQHYEIGIVFSIDNPVGGQGPIPPGRFDIILGSTSSSTQSSSLFSEGSSGFGSGESGGSGATSSGGETTGGSVSLGSGPGVGGGTVSEVSGDLSRAPEVAGGNLDGRPAGYRFDGVPMGLLIGLLLVALIAARFIRNFLNSIIVAKSSGGEP